MPIIKTKTPKPIVVVGLQEGSNAYIEVDLSTRIWDCLDAELKIWKSGTPTGTPDTDTSLIITDCILSADKLTLTGNTHVLFFSPSISLKMEPTKLTITITNSSVFDNTYVIDITEDEYNNIVNFIAGCDFPVIA